MLIIPAIDILDGKVVRLMKGDFSTAKSYSDSPLEQAIIYNSFDFEWIHIVDLSGSLEGSISTKKILEEIKLKTDLKIEFGGGIRTANDVFDLLSLGVDKVVIGSLPFINKPEYEVVLQNVSPESIIVAADTKRGEIVLKGWSENSSLEISSYIEQCTTQGLKFFLITDIDKDGMLEGPNTRLYENLKTLFPEIYVIASGGISSMKDLNDLNEINCEAVVVGKAIYENRIDLEELSKFGK